jgi:hypothetical protein
MGWTGKKEEEMERNKLRGWGGDEGRMKRCKGRDAEERKERKG